MPFTPTHIAAAVPIAWLLRWKVPFSALAIGCLVCDLGVFYPAIVPYEAMHSVAGILTHCLPIGISFYFVYQWVLKEPMVELLPNNIRSRLLGFAGTRPGFSLKSLLVIVLCVIAGSCTHVFWDSFTHAGRWGTRMLPMLNEIAYVSTNDRAIRWYAIAQHASSILFLPPLAFAFIRWVFKQPPAETIPQRWRLPGRYLAIAISLLIFYAAVHFAVVWRSDVFTHGAVFVLRSTVRYSGAICFVALLGYCITANIIWSRDEARAQ